MELLQLFQKNKYKEFCLSYKQGSISVDNFHSEIEKNIPYIEFILRQQKENYDLSYIDYLIENNFSENLILFIDSIKNNINPQSIASEMVMTDYIVSLVDKKKDDMLFDYLMDNPVKDWSNYQSHQSLFNHFVIHDYEYSLNRFYSRKTNPQNYFIDFFQSNLSIEGKSYHHFERLKIKNPQLLMDIICSQRTGYVYMKSPLQEPTQTMHSGIVNLKSRPSNPSKAKEIWLTYILECNLGSKTNVKNKSLKI